MMTSEEKEKEYLAKLVLDQQKAIYAQATKDFPTYFRAAWNVLEPKTKLKRNWHQDLIAEYLQACHIGQIKRLIINIGPRNLKSNLVTVTFPTWTWIDVPERRYIFTSYGDGLSTKHSVDRRTLIESDWYQSGWSDRFAMSSDQNVKTEFTNDRRGGMLATSMHGAVTGKGCDFLIVDDPHDAQKAYSEAIRESDISAFNQKFSTRLNDKKNGVIIVVMQRLHEQDLSGTLLDQGGWELLKLEGECEEPKTIHFPMSGRSIVRDVGDLLHPEREGPTEIAEHRRTLGSAGFAAQIQQEPTPLKGKIIDPSMFKFYTALPPKFQEEIQSWDMSFKDTAKSDFVSGQGWGRIGADFYLMPHCVHGRLSFTATITALKNFSLHYPRTRRKIVEDKANGPAVISMLKSQVPGLVEYNPKDSKEARAHAVLPFIEAGNVHLPHRSIAPWVDKFLKEVAAFDGKGTKKDDQVDAMTQALLHFSKSSIEDLKRLTTM